MTASADQRRAAAIADSGWDDDFTFTQPHNPAFWLYIIACAFGVHALIGLAQPNARLVMPAMVLGLIGWGLYTLPWVWFISHRDRFKRGTGRVALVAFGWGALVATWLIALPGNAGVFSILGKVFGADFAATWGPAISAPLVEESAKGIGIVVVVLLAAKHLTTAYDGFVLGAFVGLGFQVAEDWVYSTSAAAASFGQDQASAVFGTLFARGILAGLVSHALYSAIFGAGIGWWVQHRDASLGVRLKGLAPMLLAMGMHGLWDRLSSLPAAFRVATPFTVLLFIATIVVFGRWTDRQLRPWAADLLAPEVERGLVTDAEIAALVGSPKDRRHLVRDVRRAEGKQSGKRQRHVLDAELDLMQALADDPTESGDEVDFRRSEIARLRAGRPLQQRV